MRRRNEMKKMTTILTLIALALTLTTTSLGQTAKRNKPGTPARPNNVIDADGWPIGHLRNRTGKTPETSHKEFDKGYLSPYVARGYRGTTTVNQGFNKSDILSGGGGNDALRKTANARWNRATAGFLTTDPQGPIYTPARRNVTGNYSFSVGPNISDRKSSRLNAANTYTGTTTVNQGWRNSFAINWGDGHGTTGSARARRRSFEGDPDQPIVIGSAHNKGNQAIGHNANPRVT